jgi:hypothetical protein
MRERSKVAASWGSGTSSLQAKLSNSLRRPSQTARPSCSCGKLVKYWKGAGSPYSSPMNRSGRNGERRVAAAASRSASGAARPRGDHPRAVADLVVVLARDHEAPPREPEGRLAPGTPAEVGVLAGEHERLGVGLGQVLHLP